MNEQGIDFNVNGSIEDYNGDGVADETQYNGSVGCKCCRLPRR